MKLLDPSTAADESLRAEAVKEIDTVIFQIFKYKTALLSLQKDLHANEDAQVKAGSFKNNLDQQIATSKEEIR